MGSKERIHSERKKKMGSKYIKKWEVKKVGGKVRGKKKRKKEKLIME